MDIWDEIKKLSGYQSGNGGVDSYGVDHSGFSTRDELEYQSARLARENQLAEGFAKQGIAEEDYPQFGTDFWGGSPENNYGFGSSNISQNIQNVTNQLNNNGFNNSADNGQVTTNSDYTVNTESLVGKPSSYFQNNNQQQLQMPAGTQQQITMPSYELQQQLQQPSTWDKVKNAANNFAGGTEAFSVGYATGATLGNFDEGMGAATAAVTFNPNNYTMGRNATRQLQNDLQQQHPIAYGVGEFTGAMTTPMHLAKGENFKQKAFNALTDTLNASAGYAENLNDFGTNLAVNGIANIAGLTLDKIPITRAVGSTTAKLLTNGRKVVKQGINSFGDKLKNMYYKEDEDEERYY